MARKKRPALPKEPPHLATRDYVVSLGLPAFALGIGLTMTGYVQFWMGLFVMGGGLAWFAIDIWLLRRRLGKVGVGAGMAFCVAVALLVGWMVFRPAHLRIALFLPGMAAYPAGTEIGGVKWKPGYTDLRLVLVNDGAASYSEVDALLRSNYFVAEVGFVDGFSGCKVSPAMPFMVSGSALTILGKDGKPVQTVPLTGPWHSNQVRIHCDKLIAGDKIEAVVAIEKGQQLPPWASVAVDYDAYGRGRNQTMAVCF